MDRGALSGCYQGGVSRKELRQPHSAGDNRAEITEDGDKMMPSGLLPDFVLPPILLNMSNNRHKFFTPFGGKFPFLKKVK